MVLPSSGQEKSTVATAVPKNKSYSISHVNPPPKWNAVFQAIDTGLVRRLTAVGLKREQPLAVQCCTIQVALIGVEPAAVSARITLVDIDQQQVYSKEYRGEGKGQGNANGGVNEMLDTFMQDQTMLRALKGT